MLKNVRLRLTLATAASILIFIIFLTVMTFSFANYSTMENIDTRLTFTQKNIASTLQNTPPIYRTEALMKEDIQKLAEQNIYVAIWHGDGSIYYLNFYDDDLLSLLQGVVGKNADKSGIVKNNTQFFESFLRIHTVKLSLTDQDVYLQVFVNISWEKALLTSLLSALLIIAITGGIIAIFMGCVLVAKVMIPVDNAWRQQQEFVANASHELRTPIAIIQATLETLQDDLNDYWKAQEQQEHNAPDKTATETTEATAESTDTEPPEDFGAKETNYWLNSALKECKRMSQLVNDMLFLAKADAGQDINLKTAINLSTVVEDTVLQMEPLFKDANINLTWDIAENVHCLGDSSRLKQVLIILLDNAIKYTPGKGDAFVSLQTKGDKIILQVKDSGIGIAKEDQKHLFQRFYRVDKARSRSQGGTGLGLSIAQWIARTHNGKITVESEPGKGTSFFVELTAVKQK
ncbi:MAG: hypothetical protein HFI72_00700 [Peptococcaceae bacterium]|jgi:two-component system sensor histidine kinase CiaH|nr:hypothetical protein [Peptococcaceae bacterium]